MKHLLTALFLSITLLTQSSPNQTSAHRQAILYDGPSETYAENGVLEPGVEVTIIERNNIGNWLHIQLKREDGSIREDGWVMSGFLNLNPTLKFSEVPVNTQLADADLSTVESQSLIQLYAVPIISPVSDSMREVYALGQSLGNDSRAITKIGDSLSASENYLIPMSQNDYVLGPYDYLLPTIQYFGKSAGIPSAASRIGLSTLVVFDPMWATDERCEPGESPIECEYRVKKPSIAFILFGPNDVTSMDSDTYRRQMSKIIELSLDFGVIPVLSTFSVDPEYEFWWQAIGLNLVLVELAETYQVPLINMWAAARPLPEYGLDQDKIHPKHSGFEYLKFDTGHESWYGVSLQNLLSLCMLDEIRRTIELEETL